MSSRNWLPISLIVVAAAIVIAALIVAFSPLLWTDHNISSPAQLAKPLPSGCSIQAVGIPPNGEQFIARCPSWVEF
jgi:hypothetical protein